MDDQSVSGHGSIDIERSGLRISARDAPDAVLVRSARIHSRGVNRIARINAEHGLVEWRVLAVKNGGRELMTSGSAARRPA